MRLLGFATAALAVDPVGLAAPESAVGDRRYSELFTATLDDYRDTLVDQIHNAPPLIGYLRLPVRQRRKIGVHYNVKGDV